MMEAEIAAGVMVTQDMLYMYHLLESLELKVELSMVLKMDNSGAVDGSGRLYPDQWLDLV